MPKNIYKNKSFIDSKDIFVSGYEGYNSYRIPAIIVTHKGTILAFCEGRKNSVKDYGYIDIVLKRSFDNGYTWEKMQIVFSSPPDTVGNPCPVIDRNTGVIYLLFCKNLGNGGEGDIRAGKAPRYVFIMQSNDDGETWSEPLEITKDVKLPSWTWYATGPCHGIQLKNGRIVIPCNHAVFDDTIKNSRPTQSHIIYSDDHGVSWHIGGILEEETNECVALEINNGLLYLNMRNTFGKNRRAYALSSDGGITWSKVQFDTTLIEPVCQGSVIRFTDAMLAKKRVVFSNPASIDREKMTIRMSYDEGKTWEVSKLLNDGPSAYSDLAIASDMCICCFYENGKNSPYEKITLTKFNIEWLTNGLDYFYI